LVLELDPLDRRSLDLHGHEILVVHDLIKAENKYIRPEEKQIFYLKNCRHIQSRLGVVDVHDLNESKSILVSNVLVGLYLDA